MTRSAYTKYQEILARREIPSSSFQEMLCMVGALIYNRTMYMMLISNRLQHFCLFLYMNCFECICEYIAFVCKRMQGIRKNGSTILNERVSNVGMGVIG